MPRNVRNSWVDLSVDGRSDIGTGPVSADGGMSAHFKVRDNGRVVNSVSVETGEWRGKLFLRVFDPDGKLLFEHETVR